MSSLKELREAAVASTTNIPNTTSEVRPVPAPPVAEAPTSDQGHPRRWGILAVLAAVAFMAQLDLFIVNIAVPAMSRSFGGASLGDLSWVLNAYAIVFAALLVPAGRLADHFGRRRFLLWGVVVFTAASVLCALAPSLGVLVAGRVLQAAGAAMVVPTSLGLLLPAFAQRQHGLVVGVWAGVGAVAASSGAPVGGLLVGIDWRWIFLVNVPIGVATVIAGRILLPEIRAERGARLPDPFSVVAVFLAIAAVVFVTVEGGDRGWTSATEIGLYALAAVLVAAAVWRSIVHPHAVVERTLFRSRAFTTASVALFVFFLGFASWLLVTVLFLEDAWGWSAVRTGLAIVPGPLMAAVFAVNSNRVAQAFGRRRVAVGGPLFFAAAALFWIFATSAHGGYWAGFFPGLIIGGTGAGLSQAPLFASAGTLPPDRATTGSAVLNMSRQVGSALGVAITVVLLAVAKPEALGLYHRVWWFIAATMIAASAISLAGGRSRPAVVTTAG
jgi:EmrB/QacA subfamily drug resistance transporter